MAFGITLQGGLIVYLWTNLLYSLNEFGNIIAAFLSIFLIDPRCPKKIYPGLTIFSPFTKNRAITFAYSIASPGIIFDINPERPPLALLSYSE
jgi:hypothetical protein